MRRFDLASVTALAVFASGCDFGTLDDLATEGTETGSDESTAQARAIWKVYDKPEDEVKKALADLDGVASRAGALPVKVRIGDLTKEDLALVGFPNKDAAAPQGMLLVSELDCSLDQVEKLVAAKNQTTLYPGLYESYSREYTSSIDDFVAGRSPTVTWKTEYTATAVGRTYLSKLTGGGRRIPGAGPGGKSVFLSRVYTNEPATFIKGDGDASFEQDYQIEAYYERAPKKVLHFYGLWRQFRLSSITSEDDLYVNLVLGNLADFDIRSSKICRDNAPAATF